MADKARIRRSIKDLQYVKTWQLIILLIISLLVSATFLRLNNIGMVERREAVISADEEGNGDIIIQRLYELQRYVSTHMNTDLSGGVKLQASYSRDWAAWNADRYSAQNANGDIYQKAVDVCKPQFSYTSSAYIHCISSELDKYPPASDLASATSEPPEAAYIHSFTSPLWSPDWAGWTVLISVLLTLFIIIRLASIAILRLMLRQRYKDI